jgi:hypothetical protein
MQHLTAPRIRQIILTAIDSGRFASALELAAYLSVSRRSLERSMLEGASEKMDQAAQRKLVHLAVELRVITTDRESAHSP